MQGLFVSLAVGYSLGLGTLRRKGIKQRPWLEMSRLETESVYLGHQVKKLRACGDTSMRVILDMVPGQALYDIRRVRIQSDWLERVFELLQPQGVFCVTREALLVASVRGLAHLWLDVGRWWHQSGHVPMGSNAEAIAVQEALSRYQVSSSIGGRGDATVKISADEMELFTRLLRPQVHRSMRHALRPGSIHGRRLLEDQIS